MSRTAVAADMRTCFRIFYDDGSSQKFHSWTGCQSLSVKYARNKDVR